MRTIDKQIKSQLLKIKELKKIAYSLNKQNQLNGSELN